MKRIQTYYKKKILKVILFSRRKGQTGMTTDQEKGDVSSNDIEYLHIYCPNCSKIILNIIIFIYIFIAFTLVFIGLSLTNSNLGMWIAITGVSMIALPVLTLGIMAVFAIIIIISNYIVCISCANYCKDRYKDRYKEENSNLL